MVLIPLVIFVGACGESDADTDTLCARLGDPEVSCRFEGKWENSYIEYDAFVRVTAARAGALNMSIGQIGERRSYSASTFTGVSGKPTNLPLE